MTWSLLYRGAWLLALSLACGGAAEHDAAQDEELSVTGSDGTGSDPLLVPLPSRVPSGTVSSQSDSSCVRLPPMSPRSATRSYAESCAVTSFEPLPEPMSSNSDARARLVGRWQVCGEAALYGSHMHDGIEFGGNGRNQLLRVRNGDLLIPIADAQGVYYLLSSGQFMQRGELLLNEYAGLMRFDVSGDAMQLELPEQGQRVRYARVAPNEESAAANQFSTSALGCSMAGVWDTVQGSASPAAFAFNSQGEWFGGAWGSDLCQARSMYGTYNLIDRSPGPIVDNFDLLDITFELITNVGAGRCDYWFGAGFLPSFSDDCNRVELESSWDNCTGGRGYLDGPRETLIRRAP